MADSIEWVTGKGYWIPERDGVEFTGLYDGDPVKFFATSEAIAHAAGVNEHLDAETAMATFQEKFGRISSIAFWMWGTSDKSATEYVITEAVVEACPGR